jgi:hypothetical protein
MLDVIARYVALEYWGNCECQSTMNRQAGSSAVATHWKLPLAMAECRPSIEHGMSRWADALP